MVFSGLMITKMHKQCKCETLFYKMYEMPALLYTNIWISSSLGVSVQS